LAKKAEEEEELKIEECTFKPRVNERSKILSKQRSNREFHSEMLDSCEVNEVIGSNSYAKLGRFNAKSKEKQRGVNNSLSSKR